MATTVLSSWILLIVISSAACQTQINEHCKVKQHAGTCELITSCTYAMAILSRKEFQTLRSMLCGFEGSVPKVCCPTFDKYDKTTTTKQIRTTTMPYADKNFAKEVVTTTHRPPPPEPSVLPGRDVCGSINGEEKIYGGVLTDIDEFPWLARIRTYNPVTNQEQFACSGTLISDRYVVTAAHCVVVFKAIGVRLGEWDTETHIDCQEDFCNEGPVDVKVEKVTVYPGYDRRNITSGDISLLRLERPVQFTDFIKPVCLPTTAYIAGQDYIDSTYTTAGWGKTEFGEPSVLMRKVTLDAVSYPICTAAMPELPKVDPPNVICAGGMKGLDSCQGDSGGPLLRIVGENYVQNWYLYGVTSYGVARCGSAGKPGVYTRVTAYMDWILLVVGGK